MNSELVKLGAAAIEQLTLSEGVTPLGIEGRQMIAEAVLDAVAAAYAPPKASTFGYHGWHEVSHDARFASTEHGVYSCFSMKGEVRAYRQPRDGTDRRELTVDGSTIDDAMLAAEREDAIISAITKAADEPKTPILSYRPNEFDDWGMIRYNDGTMFATVRRPLSKEEADEARRTKADPYEGISLMLLSAATGVMAEPLESRRRLIEMCAAVAEAEKARNVAVRENIDAPDWERVAAGYHGEAAERIRAAILHLAGTFASPAQETSQ
jgi:hypothetical protein